MKKTIVMLLAMLISVAGFAQGIPAYNRYGNYGDGYKYDEHTGRRGMEQTIVAVGGTAYLFLPSYIRELDIKSVKFVSNDYVSIVSQNSRECTIKGKRPTNNVQVICRYTWSSTENGTKRSHDDVFTFNVKVERVDPENIILPQSIEVGWGKTVRIPTQLYPEYSSCGLTFASGDLDIAKVSVEGMVEGLALGETEITVKTTNGLTATTMLKVIVPPCEKIDFETATYGSLSHIGDEMTFLPIITPKQSQPKYEWSSSDESIITIDQNGHAKVVGIGKAAIWIRTDNGKAHYKNFKIKEEK